MLSLEITNYILSWKNTEGITEYDIILCVKKYICKTYILSYTLLFLGN